MKFIPFCAAEDYFFPVKTYLTQSAANKKKSFHELAAG